MIHDKRWDVYTEENYYLIKVGYSVEVSGSDAMNVFWEVIEDHIFKESK